MRRRLRLAVLHAIFLSASVAGAAAPPFAGVTATTVFALTADTPVPDDDSLVDLLPVGLPGVVVDVDVHLNLRHSSPDQLDVRLVSPRGTVVALSTDNGGGNDDVFAGAVFDDQAPPRDGGRSAACVRNVTFATGVPIGTVQPEGALSAVIGEPAAGPWALVVVDDTGGTTGTLVGWGLTLTTMAALPAAAPAHTLAGGGGEIPDGDADGLASTVTAAGLGTRLLGVRVHIDVAHPRADQLDVFLTAPGGRRIDLVTDVGGGAANLYAGTTFDDRAGDPVSDATLPDDGAPLAAAVPEGALGAFLGDDPTGTWTLEVRDDTGGTEGTLRGWSLELTTTTSCGDGVLDPGEACDDGNLAGGDGCEATCTATPPAPGGGDGGETCDDCTDDDGDGLVDALDPACAGAPLTLRAVSLRARGDRATLRLEAALGAEVPGDGAVGLLLADDGGPAACGTVGALARRGRDGAAARGRLAGGNVTVRLRTRGGTLVVKGRGLALGALDDPALRVGLRIGTRTWLGAGTLRARGPRRVLP